MPDSPATQNHIQRAAATALNALILCARFPSIALRLGPQIRQQARAFASEKPFLPAFWDIIEHQAQNNPREPLSPDLLGTRASVSECGFSLEELDEVSRLYCEGPFARIENEQVALHQLQELLISNIGSLPARRSDKILALRDQADFLIKIADASPNDSIAKPISPFAGLANGGLVSVTRIARRPTGIAVFDSGALQGGLPTGASLIIAGPTNVGKSYLTYDFLVKDALLGGTPMLISLEDNEITTQARLQSFLLGRPQEEIAEMDSQALTNALRTRYPQPAIQEAIARMIIWCPNPPPGPSSIINEIGAMEEETGRSVTRFATDYIQNIDLSEYSDRDRHVRLGKASKDLIRLAQDRSKNAIIVSQAKASAYNSKDEFLSTDEALAESAAIGHNAHFILTMKMTKEENLRLIREQDKRSRINLAFTKAKMGVKDAKYAIFDGYRGHWGYFSSKQQREVAWNQLRSA